uniref:histidine kinase n=1 Tax=candidate division WOR-3 bacterium TaxID=2052148 RepID=A0A7V3ZWZ4_UNCW3
MELVNTADIEKLFSLSPEIFFILDSKKNIIYASDSVKTIGFSEEEILGTNFLHLVAGHIRPILEKRFSEASNRIVFGQRLIIRSKENVYLPFYANFFVGQDRIFLYLKNEEKILPEKLILDYLDFGLIVIDSEFHILYHNSFVSQYFQRHTFTHLEQLPYGIGSKIIERVKIGQKSMEIEYASGRIIGISVYPMDLPDLKGFLLKIKDITAEKSFERTAGGAGSYFSYVDLVSIYTHHIKNLLTPLKFNALSLRRELTDPKQIEKVERMVQHIEKINQHVRAFYSRVRTKPIEFKKVNIRKVVGHVKQLLNNDLINNGIIFEFYQNGNELVYADEIHLQQILSDLVQNAIDALKNQKGVRRITVTVKRSENRCPYCGAPFVQIEVSDTGPGIKKEDLDRIFNLGFSTKAEGWGLGLYVVDKMVKENRGIIRVYSEVGKGTTFVLYFHPATPDAVGCVEQKVKEV